MVNMVEYAVHWRTNPKRGADLVSLILCTSTQQSVALKTVRSTDDL